MGVSPNVLFREGNPPRRLDPSGPQDGHGVLAPARAGPLLPVPEAAPTGMEGHHLRLAPSPRTPGRRPRRPGAAGRGAWKRWP